MTIHIPSALRSYTNRQSEVEVAGSTLGEVLSALDAQYPGLRFRIVTEQDRIRPHIRIFVNDEQAQELEPSSLAAIGALFVATTGRRRRAR